MDKKLILDPPKRSLGQCMSCFYFYIGSKLNLCHHVNHHDTEKTDFCPDWKDIEDGPITD